MFITFEGPEGSGKTTQVPRLTASLSTQGHHVIQVREPGGTPIGDQIRNVLHDMKNQEMDPNAELLLYAASRAQLVAQVIRPHLAQGGIVICDRYADSTIAYQGYGRGLDMENLQHIIAFATGGLKPDLTFCLDIDPEQGLLRRSANGMEINRMDSLDLEFHKRVREGYLKLLDAEPSRWVKIDASQSAEAVQAAINTAVMQRLNLAAKPE